MREVRKDIKYLINLKESYPGIKVDRENVRKVLNLPKLNTMVSGPCIGRINVFFSGIGARRSI